MSTSHLVMFCSSKLILMPGGMSLVHSAYSYTGVNFRPKAILRGGTTFMMRFFAPVLILAVV